MPPSAPVELGPDRRPYRLVDLGAAGRYLASADGTPVWAYRPAAKFDAPKAQLFALVVDGTLGGRLPWGLVLAGAFLALMMELVGSPPSPSPWASTCRSPPRPPSSRAASCAGWSTAAISLKRHQTAADPSSPPAS